MDERDVLRREVPEIRQLSESVINKIAAGEVIERPASVLKELLENAVDAGARKISVDLQKGGLDRIRVSDDGCGISRDQLPLAVASHATSKIVDADDLFAVGTLGFRGEALASIGEVSHLQIRSRYSGVDEGSELRVRGGQQNPPVPCACAIGTSVEVDNLFFNTPVRRKFMRTVQTELSHCVEAFTRISLAHHRLHFVFTHNGRSIYDLPPVSDWQTRIAALCGADLAAGLIQVDDEQDGYRLFGYAANPSHSRSNNKLQYLFLNGRYIRDRALQHALGEAYRGLLLTGRYPICFLRLEMPADQVDVNVHPTKLEVRFRDSGRVYSQLLSTLRSRFLATDLTARVEPPAAETPHPPADQSSSGPVRFASRSPSEFRPYPHLPAQGGNLSSASPMADAAHATLPEAETRRDAPDAAGATKLPAAPFAGGSSEALQAHNRYLVTVCEQGLEVIDQHALHERILYEQLRVKVLGHDVEIQRLLTPEPVDLTAAEADAVLQQQSLLESLGVLVEPFGGTTVLVTGYPAMLRNVNASELIQWVADCLTSGQGTLERRDLLDELLHMCSCKAAIKAGDPLSRGEVQALLSHRHLVQDSHHCPHGRPTTLVFTREELDRRFQRI